LWSITFSAERGAEPVTVVVGEDVTVGPVVDTQPATDATQHPATHLRRALR
jgi:hypothetical protein